MVSAERCHLRDYYFISCSVIQFSRVVFQRSTVVGAKGEMGCDWALLKKFSTLVYSKTALYLKNVHQIPEKKILHSCFLISKAFTFHPCTMHIFHCTQSRSIQHLNVTVQWYQEGGPSRVFYFDPFFSLSQPKQVSLLWCAICLSLGESNNRTGDFLNCGNGK